MDEAETTEIILSPRVPASDRREAFCLEYIKDRNATKAAARAGYSATSAKTQGARLISHDAIKDRIRELTKADNARRLEDGDKLKEMLQDAATLDLSELITQGTYGITMKEFHEMDPRYRRLITEISNVSGKHGWRVNFKVFKKELAVEMLARIYGIDDGPGGGTVINVAGDLKMLVTKYLK